MIIKCRSLTQNKLPVPHYNTTVSIGNDYARTFWESFSFSGAFLQIKESDIIFEQKLFWEHKELETMENISNVLNSLQSFIFQILSNQPHDFLIGLGERNPIVSFSVIVHVSPVTARRCPILYATVTSGLHRAVNLSGSSGLFTRRFTTVVPRWITIQTYFWNFLNPPAFQIYIRLMDDKSKSFVFDAHLLRHWPAISKIPLT